MYAVCRCRVQCAVVGGRQRQWQVLCCWGGFGDVAGCCRVLLGVGVGCGVSAVVWCWWFAMAGLKFIALCVATVERCFKVPYLVGVFANASVVCVFGVCVCSCGCCCRVLVCPRCFGCLARCVGDGSFYAIGEVLCERDCSDNV